MSDEKIAEVEINADDLKERAELYEGMLIEKDEITARMKAFMTDLENDGHDSKAFATVIRIKRKGNSEEDEAQRSMIELYKEALAV